ncbi:MAG TPA: acylphosphatase [Balneolales bacterium]|nr:acylphosphatase [Balneolales bacterium]
MQSVKTAHLLIKGRVQGVGFRHFVYKTARNLGLYGWVRNLYDGKVEVLLHGDEKIVKQAIDYCKIGPSAARVDKVNIEWDYPEETDKNFTIRY